jgi:ribosomal silencing factor RsfS
VEIIEAICDYFNVSADYILGRTDTQNPDMDIRSICEKTGLSENLVGSLLSSNSGSFDFVFREFKVPLEKVYKNPQLMNYDERGRVIGINQQVFDEVFEGSLLDSLDFSLALNVIDNIKTAGITFSDCINYFFSDIEPLFSDFAALMAVIVSFHSEKNSSDLAQIKIGDINYMSGNVVMTQGEDRKEVSVIFNGLHAIELLQAQLSHAFSELVETKWRRMVDDSELYNCKKGDPDGNDTEKE